ncbi:CPBP family glutamic-type intramembrane protease [Tenacibaculum dicentrarchi]|uniref:CPBP family glutamic-type intramembrane protease n=1 Tax=Tenacibaculum dicentrarchi TaxID=669041 RepID=UPI0035151E92
MFLKNITKYRTSFLFIIILLINVIISLSLNLLDVDFGDNELKEYSIYAIFFLVVIFAPIFETVIFNLLPIKILQYFNFFKKKPFYTIFVASIAFALTHTYSIGYVLMTYIGAITINTFFITLETKGNTTRAFLLTVLLHSAYNFIGFLLIEVFDVI